MGITILCISFDDTFHETRHTVSLPAPQNPHSFHFLSFAFLRFTKFTYIISDFTTRFSDWLSLGPYLHTSQQKLFQSGWRNPQLEFQNVLLNPSLHLVSCDSFPLPPPPPTPHMKVPLSLTETSFKSPSRLKGQIDPWLCRSFLSYRKVNNLQNPGTKVTHHHTWRPYWKLL